VRIVPPILVGVVVLLAISAQAVPSPKKENWQPLPSPPLSFGLGDNGCGEGFHQALRRDWRGEWLWGPCVPTR